jgi:AP endonuclease-1
MVRASPRKKAAVNYGESANEPRSSSKSAPIKKLAEKVKAKVTGKRKAESEPEPNGIGKASKAIKKEEEDEVREVVKPAKKRKTKAKEEENGMPLAERTAVASLKKAMYIGAHVSAAGGQYTV